MQARPGRHLAVALAVCIAGTGVRVAAAEQEKRMPGGTFYFGLGATLVAAESPGAGASYEMTLELRRVLVQAGILGATGVHNYGTLLLNASFGAVLSDANSAPYVLGGIGYLARGSIGGDPSPGPEREHVVLTGEVGYLFGRERRWGQIWSGVRVLIPVATTETSGTPLPDFPWGLLTVRFLL